MPLDLLSNIMEERFFDNDVQRQIAGLRTFARLPDLAGRLKQRIRHSK